MSFKQLKQKVKSNLAQDYKAFRQIVNRPIAETVAISREMKLPSQKQYGDLANLVQCIEATEGLLFTIKTKLEQAEGRAALIETKHKEKYRREPDKAKQDPLTYTRNNTVKSLLARQKATKTLYLSLVDAYSQLARKPYQPRSNVNAPIQKMETAKHS